MANLKVDYKLVNGDVSRVEELVSEGTILPGTLCVTSKEYGSKLCLVRKDNSVDVLSRDVVEDKVFTSTEEAESYLATGEAKPGQTIVVKDGESYKYYIVGGSEGALELKEPTNIGGSAVAPEWEEL